MNLVQSQTVIVLMYNHFHKDPLGAMKGDAPINILLSKSTDIWYKKNDGQNL
jgi:hypothetical protein